MKKVLFGLILGLGLAFAFSAQAEEIKSFIGAQIEGQFAVTVDGEVVDEPGIVINGVSYLPTRTLAELAGFAVSFDAGARVIHLSKPNVESLQLLREGTDISIEDQLQRINDRISGIQAAINTNRAYLKGDGSTPEIENAIEMYEEELVQLEQEKADLETQLTTTPE